MFKVGDKVVCVGNPIWADDVLYVVKEGDVLEILNIVDGFGELWFLFNVSNEDYYRSRFFRKLDDTFATEVLENIKEQIEEEELVCL